MNNTIDVFNRYSTTIRKQDFTNLNEIRIKPCQ